MGNSKKLQKIQTGTLSEEDKNWRTIEAKIIKGKRVSVIKVKNEKERSKLPFYSNTSDIYLVLDKFEKPAQMAVYNTETHTRAKDFDWNRHSEEFPEGVLHIHTYDEKQKRIFKEPTELDKRFFKTIIRELDYDFSAIRIDKNNT